MLRLLLLLGVATILGDPGPANAHLNHGTHGTDLTELSLEELMDIEVTTVSKRAEKLSDTAAAVYVITRDDIRRSGATSIADALRQVPGLNVAQINTSNWAISARGFNSRFANKLLVLIDGRSVYTPLYSGVFWDAQDLLLEDLERIEVVRGPGATMWGANAVNGVINIITRDASQTTGGLLVGATGSEERGVGGFRLGGSRGDRLHYRVYAKYLARDASLFDSGLEARDDWRVGRAGFRTDWHLDEQNDLLVRGGMHDGSSGASYSRSIMEPPWAVMVENHDDYSGLDLMARWDHRHSSRTETKLQAYYDRTERDLGGMEEIRDNFDVEFQHWLAWGGRYQILWGLGYRTSADDITHGPTVAFTPERRRNHSTSLFVQGDVALAGERLHLILGSKHERNSHACSHHQPNLRLLWSPSPAQRFWAASSHAHRTPSRVEMDGRVDLLAYPDSGGVVNLLSIFGGRDIVSEEVTAYELGHRLRFGRRLSLDTALFYNAYEHLIGFDMGQPVMEQTPAPEHLLIPLTFSNNTTGESHGAELTADLHVTAGCRVRAAYSYLRVKLDPGPNVADLPTNAEKESPRHQGYLWPSFDLPASLSADGILRFVDELPGPGVGSYFNLDLRFGWSPHPSLELSLVGENLLEERHTEFSAWEATELGFTHADIERGGYVKAIWRF